MWGNLVTETSFISNLKFGFPTTHSDILMHLTHWQYWFWFWFTYYMVLYYVIFLRLVRYRVFKMSPKLVTSFRSHGKWGDLLVCFVPISWCTNILSNSNFILRMVEWQSESSLFTIRVRGKQWYWVYKFEVRVLDAISGVSRNVGRNCWVTERTSPFQRLGLVQAKHGVTESKLTWAAHGQNSYVSQAEGLPTRQALAPHSATLAPLAQAHHSAEMPRVLTAAPASFFVGTSVALRHTESGVAPATPTALSRVSGQSNVSTAWAPVARVGKAQHTATVPARLVAGARGVELAWRGSSAMTPKPVTNNFYLVVKQKRYAAPRLGGELGETLQARQTFASHPTSHSVQSSRRLLRTRRVLVMPSQTNITVITNSFDVMHSWYIPGLGVKLDCVPGRSTHHTIHVDHAGFYYGQCAEICGRYHHHMPIRVCALPFEHFLTWWSHYGAPFFVAGNQDRVKYTPRAVMW